MASPGLVAPTRAEILGLYRSLIRVAREFRDYNIREYTKRRTVDGFRENQKLTDTKIDRRCLFGGEESVSFGETTSPRRFSLRPESEERDGARERYYSER
ncbi:LYR motif-containing protein [Melia azedarach]|uniref:LYR motif-containing protein n=1 Tax=Melia azedarach TaxID=155640 RepID=A0ACC1XPP1_MELAZ|nr:LYR motif-containing protein [Melia azedarach]